MKIEIYKEKKILKLISSDDGHELLSSQIGLGKGALGHKRLEGDCITPEGEYEILVKNPKSGFNVSLGLSYPNKDDAKAGLEDGRISKEEYDEIVERLNSGRGTLWNTALGGKVYIHGGLEDYENTHGCVSLLKGPLEKLYKLVEVGTKVFIYP